MNQEWFSNRLAKLRDQRKLSARDLSLSLGQSAGYINKIENKKSMPSMEMFFYVCKFLGVTPEQFFSQEIQQPVLLREAMEELEKMEPEQLEHIIAIAKDINSIKTPGSKK